MLGLYNLLLQLIRQDSNIISSENSQPLLSVINKSYVSAKRFSEIIELEITLDSYLSKQK